MMVMLYDIGFFIFCILYVPVLLFKGKLSRNFLQRFGIFDEVTSRKLSSGAPKIWIQAVSVGEVMLCRIFIPLLKERYPAYDITLSTITRSGNDLARKSFSESTATVIYFPLDFSFIVKRLIALIKPRLYIMVETEIWPNLLSALASSGIPSVLINGRISDRSFGKYKLARFFLKPVLDKVSFFSMRSPTDADRIIALGAARERVKVVGNIKLDIASALQMKEAANVRELLRLADKEELFVAGSTHNGEEEIVVSAYKDLIREFPLLRLLIAPRHIDRVKEVEAMIKRAGFEPTRISFINEGRGTRDEGRGTGEPLRRSFSEASERQIFILDTIGQLNDMYAIATIVFIGGSLVRYGGHNPIEPALFEKAVLFGPHMFNFADTSRLFLDNRAAIQILDRDGLIRESKKLLNDHEAIKVLGQNARRTVIENSGAAKRNIDMISQVLK